MNVTLGQAPAAGDAFQRGLIAADYSLTIVDTVPAGGAGQATTVRAYIDFIGSTAGTQQAFRGVLYDGTTGALLASSDEQVVTSIGDPDTGIGVATDFTLTTTPDVTEGQVLRFGLLCGPPDRQLALSRVLAGTPLAGEYSPDTYSDGPADPYGTPNTDSGYGLQLIIVEEGGNTPPPILPTAPDLLLLFGV